MSWVIERALRPTPDVAGLVAELENEVSPNYGPDQNHGLSLDALFQPHIHFLVVREDGQSVGCGGIAPFDGFAELKRFYLKPVMRGRGVADAILRRLGDIAAAEGYKLLRLETGTQQHAALRFYQRSGFERCAAFGPYAAMPPEAIAASVFMEKTLI